MRKCRWENKPKYYDHPGGYKTECDSSFMFTDHKGNNPKDNEFKYCPYCGGLLVDITEEKTAEK